MSDDLKDLIKIPEDLDKVILKGFEQGKKERKIKKKNKLIKGTAAALIGLASLTVVGINNPELVSAITDINRVFEYFSGSNFEYSVEKYQEFAEVKNQTIEKKGTKITLDQVAIDDNMLVASLIVNSNKLKGFDKSKDPRDFFDLNFDIKINGEDISSYDCNVTPIGGTTGAAVITADISDIKIEDKAKVDLDITEISRNKKRLLKSNFNFNFEVTKGLNLEKYKADKSMKVEGGEVWVEDLIKTPLSSRLYIRGKVQSDGCEAGALQYFIRDNNGDILDTEFADGSCNKVGNYAAQINILSDLSDVEYIEILQLEKKERDVDENGFDKMKLICASNSLEGLNKKEEIVSRKVTNEEKEEGWALDTFTYYLDIDSDKAFMQIEDLTGKEIKVNSVSSVIIKNVEVNDEFTKVNMKVEGPYKLYRLSSIVIFDEDRNDTCRGERDEGVKIEDFKNKEVSLKLKPLDKNKKYTIAFPMQDEFKINEDNKMVIKTK